MRSSVRVYTYEEQKVDFFLPWLGVGLVTSVHCVTMCGFMVVSYAIKGTTDGTIAQRLTPHLAYQSAKIVSYVIVGIALGVIGSAFELDGVRGWVMALAGAFMILLGVSMTGWVPGLRAIAFRPPAFLVRALQRTRRKAVSDAEQGKASIATPLTFGLLTGLMPCGPLQAAQLAAAGAGSPLAGALAMLGFGVGTAPLMLGFGTVSGMLSARFRARMMLFAAVIVIVLGLVMLDRGAMMLGSPVTATSIRNAIVGGPVVELPGDFEVGEDGVAEIPLSIVNTRFQPAVVAIPADQPVRLIVDRQEANVCSDQLWIPQIGVLQDLTPFGITVVEIPATAAGSYSLTCQMGMMSGTLQVGAAVATTDRTPLLAFVAIVAVLTGLYATRPRHAGSVVDSGRAKECASPPMVSKTVLFGFPLGTIVLIVVLAGAAVIAGLAMGGQFF